MYMHAYRTKSVEGDLIDMLVLKGLGPDDARFLTRLYKAFLIGDEIQINLGTLSDDGVEEWLSYTPSTNFIENDAVLRDLESLSNSAVRSSPACSAAGNVATAPVVGGTKRGWFARLRRWLGDGLSEPLNNEGLFK